MAACQDVQGLSTRLWSNQSEDPGHDEWSSEMLREQTLSGLNQISMLNDI